MSMCMGGPSKTNVSADLIPARQPSTTVKSKNIMDKNKHEQRPSSHNTKEKQPSTIWNHNGHLNIHSKLAHPLLRKSYNQSLALLTSSITQFSNIIPAYIRNHIQNTRHIKQTFKTVHTTSTAMHTKNTHHTL